MYGALILMYMYFTLTTREVMSAAHMVEAELKLIQSGYPMTQYGVSAHLRLNIYYSLSSHYCASILIVCNGSRATILVLFNPDEVPTLGYLQLLKWYDNENKRRDLRLLRNLAPVWDKAAETLHLSGAEIKIIERNNSGDQSGRIREVVVKWLSNGCMLPESGRYPVNWRGFFHLLLDVEQGDMADALKSALSACKSNIRRTFY